MKRVLTSGVCIVVATWALGLPACADWIVIARATSSAGAGSMSNAMFGDGFSTDAPPSSPSSAAWAD